MGRPKLQIVVLFQNLAPDRTYYARSPAPPLSGILLAALTPERVEVDVLHEMVRPIDYETDADLVALSFMDFCAPHAYDVARRFREAGKTVIAGGRYPTAFPAEVAPHFDAVVVGEAERVWAGVVDDWLDGRLQELYVAPPAPPLADLPPPRYDLVEPVFDAPVVTETSRGCPFRCSYCQLNIAPKPYRTRPVEDVVRDLTATSGLPLRKRKMAMLYDNNLGGDMKHAKAVLRAVAELDLWALGVQFSFNCLYDDTFVDLLEAANCTMAFIGLESLSEPSLQAVNKRHNRVAEYREMLGRLRERGIMTFTGMMLALDEDTAEDYRTLPRKLDDVDPAAIFLSLSIPIPGTPFHRKVRAEGRIVDVDLRHYDGDHLVLRPKRVGRRETLAAFERIHRFFYAWPAVLRRGARLLRAFLAGAGSGGVRSWPRRLARAGLLAYVFLKISAFQRHRWREKVGRAGSEGTGSPGEGSPGSVDGRGPRRALATRGLPTVESVPGP